MMQEILRSEIPQGLQPTLTKAMAEYKDTVVRIYKIKQHAAAAQQNANAASGGRPLVSPARPGSGPAKPTFNGQQLPQAAVNAGTGQQWRHTCAALTAQPHKTYRSRSLDGVSGSE